VSSLIELLCRSLIFRLCGFQL